MRQNIRITLDSFDRWDVEEVQALSRALSHEHPAITSFKDSHGMLPYFEYLNALYSALATLPALESITLGAPEVKRAYESVSANSKSLKKLLRLPTLRSVHFRHFYFTPALCQATANAFTEGTTITKLKFSECTFSSGECAIILANAFGRNTSDENVSELLDTLAAVLPLNSTLQDLSFEVPPSDDDDDDGNPHIDWSPIFSALGKNTGLKTPKVDVFSSMEESLCTAMQNETLESLEFIRVPVRADTTDLWCRAFSFSSYQQGS
jgi:hypothetical protein